MYFTLEELTARGCRSLKQLAPPGPDFKNHLAEFLRQCDQCVFTMGACHVMAATLWRELQARRYAADVFRVAKDQDAIATHYVVGRSRGGPFLDVSLRWKSVAEIGTFFGESMIITGPVPPNPPVTAYRLAAWATPRGQSRMTPPSHWPFCADATFFQEAGAKADAFVAKNSSLLDSLVA